MEVSLLMFQGELLHIIIVGVQVTFLRILAHLLQVFTHLPLLIIIFVQLLVFIQLHSLQVAQLYRFQQLLPMLHAMVHQQVVLQ